MNIELKASKLLDATGLLCPMPVIKTSQAIKQVPLGEILEVRTTDPGSEPDLKAWAKMSGNELLDISYAEAEPTVFRFLIRRSA